MDVDLREIAAAYNRGMSIRALALHKGWSYGSTHARLLIAVDQGLTTMRPKSARSTVK